MAARPGSTLDAVNRSQKSRFRQLATKVAFCREVRHRPPRDGCGRLVNSTEARSRLAVKSGWLKHREYHLSFLSRMSPAVNRGKQDRSIRSHRIRPPFTLFLTMLMRNVFDQYDQPENRLTHALFCVLTRESTLVVPFLKWLGVSDHPPPKLIRVAQQSVPGEPSNSSDEEAGLPDLSIYSEDGWGVFFEMKVQAKLNSKQLRRHAATAVRFGFEKPILVAVSVEPITSSVPDGTILIQWRQMYSWFAHRMDTSFWVSEFVRYMEVFEEKSIENAYEVRGTITMFNGLRFDDDNPFHYREAKRLIRLLGDELQCRPDLQSQLGIDPEGARRPAITNDSGIWDFLPLAVARGSDFIRFPHLTLSLSAKQVVAAATIPNGISGGFRSRLQMLGEQGFLELMGELERNLRPILKRSEGSRSLFYATQRHYKSQRSKPSVDGHLEADLRTCINSKVAGVKYQPEWMEAIYKVLTRKKSNVQCGIEVRFNYKCKVVRSPDAVDLIADSWKAVGPLLDFVLSDT